VKWTPGTENEDVVDVRGQSPQGGGGGALKLGGGGLVALVAVVLVSRLFGVDLTGLLGSGGGSPPEPNSSTPGNNAPGTNHPPRGPDPDAALVDFIKFELKDIQDTFAGKLKEAGVPYRRAKLYIFTSEIDTKCGRSSSAIGPFYCPGDENAYIDLSFYRDLRQRFGAPGDFAQIYVLAHEMGHHLQKLLDADAAAKRAHPHESRNHASVRIELQADCYAGVWGNSAKQRGKLEGGDLEEGLTAAASIGDDRLQRQAGRNPNPESFTHGSSAQRTMWFRRGFDTGRLDACDTFLGEP